MDNDHGDQILVTSPKKKLHASVDRESLVRQMSGDRTGFFGKGGDAAADDDHDDDDDEYIEEIIEESDDDAIEEIIDSDEEEEYYEDEDTDEEEENENVEILEVQEDEDDGVEDGTDSASEFDPLPPPIEIPNALRPPHLRSKEKEKKKKSSYLDDDDDEDETSDFDDDDDSTVGSEVAKTLAASSRTKQSAKTYEYNHTVGDDDSDDSESDTSASPGKSSKKMTTADNTFTATGRINKNADDYDDDDSEPEVNLAPNARSSPSPKLKNEDTTASRTNSAQAASTPSSISSDPALSLRPATIRGYSFSSDSEELGIPQSAKRSGKKPGKWAKGQSSIYSQNGVSAVKPTDSTRTPSKPEQAQAVSENRPTEVLGKFDKQSSASMKKKTAGEATNSNDSNGLRGTSTVKNQPIKKTTVTSDPKEEPPAAFKVATQDPSEENARDDDHDNTEPKDDGNGPYYSFEQLKKKSVPNLDYLNREQYLSPYDFKEVFKVTKAEFATWPKWKQTKAKRSQELF